MNDRNWWVGFAFCRRTVEGFDFSKEPIKPTSLELQSPEFFEPSLLVYLRVVSKLSALDETEYDRVFEPGQNGTDPIEREGISGERIVGLHGWEPGGGGEGEGMGAGVPPRARTYTCTNPFVGFAVSSDSVSPIDHVSSGAAWGNAV